MLRSNIALFGALAASTTVLASPVSRSTASTTPQVSDHVTGTIYLGNLSSGIESFLSIRFAEDTSGNNRFPLPKPFYYPNHAVVNASQIGAACPQANKNGPFSPDASSFSEDCLTLRIDRLENTTASSNLPVMIYFYGGGFTNGQIYSPSYDPTGLLKSADANGSPVIYAAMK
jgi:carboxylesterase type B